MQNLKASTYTFTTREKVNLKNLELLVHSRKLIEYDTKNKDNNDFNENDEYIRNQISSLIDFQRLACRGYVDIDYTVDNFGRFKNTNQYGQNYSFSNMYRQIRSHLANENYIDLDIANAHYTIFINKCDEINSYYNTNLSISNLYKYINEREQIFKNMFEENQNAINKDGEILTDENFRETFKCLFTSLLYGAGIEKTIEKHKLNRDSKQVQFMISLSNEIRNITPIFINLDIYKDIHKYVYNKKRKENKLENIESCILSYILMTYERQLLEQIIELIKNDNFISGAKIHDGLHIEKDEKLTDEIIKKWETELNNMNTRKINLYNIKYELKIKPFELDNSYLELEPIYRKYLYHKKDFENSNGVCKIKDFYLVENNEQYNLLEDINDNLGLNNAVEILDRKTLEERFNDFTTFTYGKTEFLKYWLNDPNKKSYEDIIFDPSMKRTKNGKIYNTFKGFEIKKHTITQKLPTTQQEREKIIYPLLVLLRKLSGENNNNYKILMAFISHLFVLPYILTGIITVIKGEQTGQGKNTLFLLLSAIIGNNYTNCTRGLEKLFSKHSNGRVDKLLIAINELTIAESKKYIEDLKDATTEPYFEYEPKYQMPRKCENLANLFIFSNDFYSVATQSKDRRLFFIDVDNINYNDVILDNKKVSKSEFFDVIYSIIGDKKRQSNFFILRVFYDYMVQYFNDNNISNFKFQEHLDTEDKKAVQNIDNIEEFLKDYLIELLHDDEREEILEKKITNEELFNSFKTFYSKRYKNDCPFTPTSLNQRITSKYKDCISASNSGKSRYKILLINNLLMKLNLTRSDCREWEI